MFALWVAALVGGTVGHVSLTFPPARYPPLDFLDTSRTQSPCGVPKPKQAYYSDLVVGESYNFTWRMQYPHQGGYKFTLLDSAGKQVDVLSPMNGIEFAGTNDQTSESEVIRFQKQCKQCTVVMERQALEWGKSYRFRTCADVNIHDTQPEEMKCSSHGIIQKGGCQCEKGWTGDVCQYKADCLSDSDCRNAGKCVSQSGTLVTKVCYCAYGYFGKDCSQTYKGKNDNCFAYASRDEQKFETYGMFNSKCYNAEKLNDGDVIYYRKEKSDVEIILDFSSTSWVSLGWRPAELSPSCRLFPDLEGARTKRAAEQETPFIDPPTHVEQGGPPPVMPKSNGLLDSALNAPLHAMDCIDVLVGAVRDGRVRVQDLYSRDRSTPLDDEWYDGENSLVAAAGIEMDGRTVIMFRRWIQEIEPTDHPLGPGRMFTVWAKGQSQGAYTHLSPSALQGNHSNKAFYPDDVLKYHGNLNRGVLSIEFTRPVPGAPTEAPTTKAVPHTTVTLSPTTRLPVSVKAVPRQKETVRQKETEEEDGEEDNAETQRIAGEDERADVQIPVRVQGGEVAQTVRVETNKVQTQRPTSSGTSSPVHHHSEGSDDDSESENASANVVIFVSFIGVFLRFLQF